MSAFPTRWLAVAFAVSSVTFSTSAQQPAAASSPAPVVASASPAPEAGKPAAPPEPKYLWSDVHVNGQYIAMTFDDGPSAKLTPHLLDILKERNMHVTFFVLGEMVKPHPEILKRAVAEGHEIGNHSWDHPDLAKKSDDFVRSQLDRTKDEITAAIGKPVTLMRPPYGSLSKEQRRWVHDDLGYTIILWDVDPLDWKRPGPSVVEQRILEGTRNGSIILSHDIHPGTVEAMPDTFDKLLAKGYKFVTVSELIAMNQPEPPKPGKKAGASSAATGADHPAHPTPKPAPTPVLPDKITGASGQ